MKTKYFMAGEPISRIVTGCIANKQVVWNQSSLTVNDVSFGSVGKNCVTPAATLDGPSLSRRIPYGLLNGLRELCSVFLQLLSINRFETQFIERHRESFLPL
jgi:hypothetical protein